MTRNLAPSGRYDRMTMDHFFMQMGFRSCAMSPAGLVIVVLCATALSLAACQSNQKRTIDHESIANGRGVLTAMHDRYAGRWYRNIRVAQKVVRFDAEGNAQPEQLWVETVSLPGRVRAMVEDPPGDDMEIYVDGAFHIIKDGAVAQRLERAHPVLHIGYDVYCQPPATTIDQLDTAGFDLSVMHEAEWDGRRVYVVGAEAGDETSLQFWVDAEELLVRRIITKSQSGEPVEMRFTEYERFEGVWLCMEIKFYLAGRPLIHEWDVKHELLGDVDDAMFSVPGGQ